MYVRRYQPPHGLVDDLEEDVVCRIAPTISMALSTLREMVRTFDFHRYDARLNRVEHDAR